MLTVDVSRAVPFLPFPYEEALRPQLNKATGWLQNGGGKGDNYIGWVHLPEKYDKTEFARIEQAAAKIRADSEALVVIGVGGSCLGARGVIECLRSPSYNLMKKDTPNVYFIGNSLSAAATREVYDLVKDADFSVNVISKSGDAAEPAVAFRFFKALLEEKYGREGAAKRVYATTDQSRGALRSLADAEGYETFAIPDNVGGCCSVLTAAGLLPIAVAGIDVRALMDGAAEMMKVCRTSDFTNPAWQYAAMRNELYRRGKKIELLACFEPSFRLMAEWWKQLFGESEGKDGKGVFPASADFTADLHSMGQYIQQGERILMETVVRFDPDEEQLTVPSDETNGDGLSFLAGRTLHEINAQAMDAALLAHVEGGVPNMIVRAGRRGVRELGALIYFFEYACGLSGYLLGVNPFDRPGVEAYKKNMFALLGKPGFEATGEALRAKLAK